MLIRWIVQPVPTCTPSIRSRNLAGGPLPLTDTHGAINQRVFHQASPVVLLPLPRWAISRIRAIAGIPSRYRIRHWRDSTSRFGNKSPRHGGTDCHLKA